jgi:hypothetical protein
VRIAGGDFIERAARRIAELQQIDPERTAINGQRAVTPSARVEIATPNRPLAAQRAAIAKVMLVPSGKLQGFTAGECLLLSLS